MEQPCRTFYARLLGGYSLTFDRQEVQLDINQKSKAMQIFFMLVKAGKGGLSREELLRVIPDKNEGKKRRDTNLRQQIHLLRRAVERSDFPPGEYIVLQKKRYYFSLQYPMETDTDYLERVFSLIQRNLEQQKIQEELEWDEEGMLLDFCRHYTGELLPMLEGEEWVMAERAAYQSQYFFCLRRLWKILEKKEQFETMLSLCAAASQMYPYDEWQVVQIQCLLHLHRIKEARRIYDQSSRMYFEQFGTRPLDSLMEAYRWEEGSLLDVVNPLAKMKKGLKETGKNRGGYQCGYPSFLDFYHLLVRNSQRRTMPFLLLLAELQKKEKALPSEPFFPEAEDEQDFPGKMEKLRKIMEGFLDRDDVYTHYSRNQFLVLLMGADEEEGRDIARKIKESREMQNPDDAFHPEVYWGKTNCESDEK